MHARSSEWIELGYLLKPHLPVPKVAIQTSYAHMKMNIIMGMNIKEHYYVAQLNVALLHQRSNDLEIQTPGTKAIRC